MTLQSHATPEVIEKTGVVSPAPDEFDPFAHWAATLDGAVNKCNLSIGEVHFKMGADSHPVVPLASTQTKAATCLRRSRRDPQAHLVRSMLYFF
jgi:hypothetical protein